MKRFLAVMLFISTIGAMFANPLVSIYTNKFWFNSDNLFHIRFNTNLTNVTGIDFFNGTEHIAMPLDIYSLPDGTTTIPEANLNPQQGYFCITYSFDFSWTSVEEVHWGPSTDNDISSLSLGESGMQIYIEDGCSGDYDQSKFHANRNANVTWVKEIGNNSPSNWDSRARSYVQVACRDTYGVPVPNVPVYLSYLYYSWQNTGTNGCAADSVYCTKLNVKVMDAMQATAVLDTTFFAEPGASYLFNALLPSSASDDPVLQVALGTFSIYPSVLRSSLSSSIRLDYDAKLPANAQVELYDIKGRLIVKQVYTGTGMQWQIPKLASGVYFLRLSAGKANLGNSKLIVLK